MHWVVFCLWSSKVECMTKLPGDLLYELIIINTREELNCPGFSLSVVGELKSTAPEPHRNQ